MTSSPLPSTPEPNGLFVRSAGSIKTVSAWYGQSELTAILNEQQTAEVVRVLTSPLAAIQVVGSVSKFNIPKTF